MHNIVVILAVVLLIRYFAIDGGALMGATVSYGWTEESCAVKKGIVDSEADPPGSKVTADCVDKSEVSHWLAKGQRI